MIPMLIIVLLTLVGLLLALIAYRERYNGKLIESFKLHNNTMSSSILEFSKRITSLKTRISELEYVNNQLEKDLETSQQLQHNYLEDIDKMKKEKEKDLEIDIFTLASLNAIIRDQAENIGKDDKELKELKQRAESAEQRAESAEQRAESEEQRAESGEKRIRELEDQLTIKNHNSETLTAEFKRAINENQELQMKLKEKEAEVLRIRENQKEMTEELRWFKMLTRAQLKNLAMPEEKIEEFMEAVEYGVSHQINNGMERIVSACV